VPRIIGNRLQRLTFSNPADRRCDGRAVSWRTLAPGRRDDRNTCHRIACDLPKCTRRRRSAGQFSVFCAALLTPTKATPYSQWALSPVDIAPMKGRSTDVIRDCHEPWERRHVVAVHVAFEFAKRLIQGRQVLRTTVHGHRQLSANWEEMQ